MPTAEDNVADDRRRRVLANLSIPRSALEVARQMVRDAHAPFDKLAPFPQIANEVGVVLDELEGLGLVKNIGVVDDVAGALDLVASDDDLPDMHPEKAEQYADRLATGNKDSWKLAEGALWYWTAAGYEALTS